MYYILTIFYHEETKLPVIKYKDEICIKSRTVADIFRYKNTIKSIHDHVDPEDKRRLSELGPKSKHNEALPSEKSPMKKNEKNTIYINGSGIYSLILHSKLECVQVLKRLVAKEALPSIRMAGRYSYDDMSHKYNDSLTFKIDNELNLHIKVVSFLRRGIQTASLLLH